MELVVERNHAPTASLFSDTDPYSVFSPEERKVQFLLDVRRALARTILDDVFEGNMFMAFIMSLVVGLIVYDQLMTWRHPFVDNETFELVKHVMVSRIHFIRTKDLTRRDNPQGWLRIFHHPNLYG